MTAYTMLELMTLELEDPKKISFPDTFKLQCLNNAQNTVARMLHPKYLTELEVSKADFAVTGGVTDFINAQYLGYNVLGAANGVIRVSDATTDIVMTNIGIKNVKNNENLWLTGTVRNPLYYIFQNKIYTLPATGIGTIDVFYIRMPAPLYATYTAATGSTTAITTTTTGISTVAADYYNGGYIYNKTKFVYYYIYDSSYTPSTATLNIHTTQAGDAPATGNTFYILGKGFETLNLSTVTCELNPLFHDIVIKFAEAECWGRKERLDRRNTALEEAISNIDTFNKKAMKSEGIGTENENM